MIIVLGDSGIRDEHLAEKTEVVCFQGHHFQHFLCGRVKWAERDLSGIHVAIVNDEVDIPCVHD